MRKLLTKKQNLENGRRLREANERVRREMTRRALYEAACVREWERRGLKTNAI